MRGNGFGRQVHRAAIAALTALAAALALAPAASAEPARYLWFFQAPEGAGVGASDYSGQPPNMRLEVVRNGQLIGAANGGPWSEAFVELSTLQVGDVANLYAGAALRASVAYDGKPTIPNPCVGSRVFTGTRSDGAVVEDAGAWSGSGSLGTFNWAVWDDENPFTVTLRYRLAATDHVYASTYQELPAVGVSSYLERGVGPCPPPPVVNPPAPFPVQPILTPMLPTADSLSRSAVQRSLVTAGPRLRKLRLAALARKRTLALPFTASEPGTVKYTLSASGGKRIATGTLAFKAPGTRNVTLRLSAAGRTALRRAKSGKLRLDATFTPRRAGAKPISAGTSVTLKRGK